MRVVKIVGAAIPTPHDGRWLVAWNPHVVFGDLAVDSTADLKEARRFADASQIIEEWKTVSRVQPMRPDGEPNRPLSSLTIKIEDEK